jgi:hypothetical protein
MEKVTGVAAVISFRRCKIFHVLFITEFYKQVLYPTFALILDIVGGRTVGILNKL